MSAVGEIGRRTEMLRNQETDVLGAVSMPGYFGAMTALEQSDLNATDYSMHEGGAVGLGVSAVIAAGTNVVAERLENRAANRGTESKLATHIRVVGDYGAVAVGTLAAIVYESGVASGKPADVSGMVVGAIGAAGGLKTGQFIADRVGDLADQNAMQQSRP